jgi:hypothetical protein
MIWQYCLLVCIWQEVAFTTIQNKLACKGLANIGITFLYLSLASLAIIKICNFLAGSLAAQLLFNAQAEQ